MILGLDLRCLPQDGSPGAGVAHAARELTRIMVRLYPEISWIAYLPEGAAWDEEAEQLRQCEIIRLKQNSGAALRQALKIAPCNKLFVPSGSVAPGLRVPSIPWVHDVAIFRSSSWFPQSLFRRALTTRLFLRGVKQAPFVFSVSEFTKQELCGLAKIEESKVIVTQEGGDMVLSELAHTDLAESKRRARLRLADRGVTQPFILWMGTLEPRKNVETLIHAWMEASSDFSQPVDLVIAGKDGWKLGSIHRALALGVAFKGEGSSRLHRIQSILDDDRRDLLLAAEVVALPSWHEGFGLVALEAMQAGTAVIVSEEGGMKEIVGETGIVLPPWDISAWSAALVGIMQDAEARQSLAREGMSRSQGFTWDRVARIVVERLTESV